MGLPLNHSRFRAWDSGVQALCPEHPERFIGLQKDLMKGLVQGCIRVYEAVYEGSRSGFRRLSMGFAGTSQL